MNSSSAIETAERFTSARVVTFASSATARVRSAGSMKSMIGRDISSSRVQPRTRSQPLFSEVK